MRRAAGLVAVAVLAAAAGGCGNQAVAPPPIVLPPPIVEEMFPAPRSIQIFYGTAIWVRFAEPLDPATIDERTVFLKIDTRRIPADVDWDAAGRRIVITPHNDLDLNRTHTVLLTTAIRTVVDIPLERDVSWQFRTMGARIPSPEGPPQGIAGKGPWTSLSWRATESSAGNIRYRVHAGLDSAAVAAHTSLVGQPASAIYRPNPAWPLGATVFWAVTAVNATTGESVDGPVVSFGTVPAGTPIDSLDLGPSEWGYWFMSQPNLHPCYADLISGNGYTAAARYSLANIPAGIELAGARIDAVTPPSNWPFLSIANAAIWVARNEWGPCTVTTGFPVHDIDIGELSTATILPPGRLRFDSPAFVAYLQDVLPAAAPFEVVLRSERTINYAGWGNNNEGRLRIQYYRTAPAPAGPLARQARRR